MKGAIVAETGLARACRTLIKQTGGMLALARIEVSIPDALRKVQ
jgi:hypothetical protein